MNAVKIYLNKKSGLWLGLGLLLLLGIALLAKPEQFSQAQEADVTFEASDYVSAAGDSAITSQRTTLDWTYFEQSGMLDGLQVTPTGLTLAADTAVGSYVSGPIRSPLGFTTDIGPAWLAEVPEDTSVEVQIRLSQDGQDWDDWTNVPVEFYPIRDGEYGGTMVWVDQAEAHAQFKVTLSATPGGPVPSFQHLTLFFNDTSQGPTTSTAAATAASLHSQGDGDSLVCPAQPAIIWRSEWGCPPGQDSPDWPPAYKPVTHVVINHTATPNDADDWARVVRSIWNYHANTLGWGDVGYNYIIDPLGNIYEGRAGGDNVVGAFDGFNKGAMGIGFIGCYGECDYLGIPNVDPSQTMLEAGADLIAWKFGQDGIDPFGEGSYCDETLPNIVGRSEVTCRGASLSPGSWLTAEIPWMRDGVAERLETCQLADPPTIDAILPTSGLISEEVTLVVEGSNFKPTESGFLVELVGSDDTRYTLSVVSGTATATWFEAIIPADLLPVDLYDVVVTNPDGQSDTLEDAYEAWADTSDPAPVINNVSPTSGLISDTVTLTVTGQNFASTETGFTVELKAADGTLYQLQLGATQTLTTVEAIITANQLPAGLYDLVVTNPDGQNDTLAAAYEALADNGGGQGTLIQVTPASLQIGLGVTGTTTVEVVDITNLYGLDIELSYNPSVADVVDADPNTTGTQVELGDFFDGTNFSVVQNQAENGVIKLVATRQSPATGFTGTGSLINITWEGQTTGTTPVTLDQVKLSDPNGQAISATRQDGEIIVKSGVIVKGRVDLQSRENDSGVVVKAGDVETRTDAEGQFTMPMDSDNYNLTLTIPGYLDGQAEGQIPADAQEMDLGEITLLGGDVTNDQEIDIFDLALIGSRYGSDDPVADINGDGLVDIFDLSLAASNYGQRGPRIMGLDTQLRSTLDEVGFVPFEPGLEPEPAKIALGQNLFF